jgi:multisubunit Na+/H+ antiporter MnhC subunit
MKTTAYILIAIGSLSTIGAFMALARGARTSFIGIGLIVLGAYLLSRAEKKRIEDQNKRDWSK